jgi:hypothetical protein
MAQGTQRQPKADQQGDHEDGELQPEDLGRQSPLPHHAPSPRRRPCREHNAHNPVNAGYEDYEDNRDGLVAAV